MANVTLLSLECGLFQKSGAELKEAFEGIPKTVTGVNLTNNAFDFIQAPSLQRLSIRANVATLNFITNSENKTVPELADVLAGLPESVTSVKLGWDNREQAKNAVVKLCDHIK